MVIAKKSEKGQAIIVIVIGFIVILGFVGLAIDGGMVYSDRRNAQNAADASALAGGGAAALSLENSHVFWSQWSCPSDNRIQAAISAAQTAAISRAAGNLFTIGTNAATGNYVTVQCGSTTNGAGYTDKYFDVTVHISTTTRTNFVQVVIGNRGIPSQVEAVTRVRPRHPIAWGNAIVALNPSGCAGQNNGTGFHGNPGTEVWGGGVLSNGCLQMDGAASTWIQQPWNATYGSECSKCDFVTGPITTTQNALTPGLTPDKLTSDDYTLPEPDCTNRWVSGIGGDLSPGLYCVNGDLTIHNDTTGSGITIYVTGKLTINGNVTVKLSALRGNEPGVNGAVPGVLFFIPQSNPGPVKLNGTSDSLFSGAVYAPGASVDLTGTGNTESYNCQIIGWNVTAGGNAATGIHYDDAIAANQPSSLDLQH